MEINKAVAYINDWNLLVGFVEHDEYGDLCKETFWNSDMALEMGRHKSNAFYEDSEDFIRWIGNRITDGWDSNGALWNAWNDYLHANEEYLPALRDW